MFDAVQNSSDDVFAPDLVVAFGAAAASDVLLLKNQRNVNVGS